ncbi:MAG: FAD/NAD(P)-binding oxidoreductase [Rhodocyclaceae bacterium]|nr:FAD/NAD(P)-binding oxidoreductase [Rhodocyclaceae bacterium]
MNDNSNDLSRRNFIKFGGVAAASIAAVGASTMSQSAQAAMVGTKGKANLPKAKGPRLVVVGGGTSGLTIAKYVKKANPKLDVVLVEKRDMYSSCFASNLLYSGMISLEFLADHSFLDAAVNNKYTFFNATVTGLDRAARKLMTNEGEIDYDYLVVAPGIHYDYSRIGVTDPEVEFMLRQNAPGGFVSPTEHITIRDKVRNFEGGTFVITVPGGNYRCLPGPYERGCMVAAAFKKNKVKAKVLVLDHNPNFTIKAAGFSAAYKELYGDYIEYKPSSAIKSVDPVKKVITTEFDTINYDEATIYPGVRGSRLLEALGLMDPKSPQKEALIDDHKYNFPGDDRVYVTGDSRPMGFSKSANTSNTEAKYVAKLIAARSLGKEIDWVSPETICYSMCNAEPGEAISVSARYVYDNAKKAFGFSPDTTMDEHRDVAKGNRLIEWNKGMYRDLFA